MAHTNLPFPPPPETVPLLEEIVVSPSAPQWFKEFVQKLKTAGPHVDWMRWFEMIEPCVHTIVAEEGTWSLRVDDVDIGTQPILNLIAGNGVTIEGTEDAGNTEVEAEIAVRFPNGPAEVGNGQWIGGIINRTAGAATVNHNPFMHDNSGTPLSSPNRVSMPAAGWGGNCLAYTDSAHVAGQIDRMGLDIDRLFGLGVTSGGPVDGFNTVPMSAAGVFADLENLHWLYCDSGSGLSLLLRGLGIVSPTWRSWSAEFIPDTNFSLIGGTGAAVGGSTTAYNSFFGFSQQATETFVEMVVPFACTASRMFVTTTSAQPAGADAGLTLTFRLDEADTTLVVNVPAGGAAGVYVDLTHTVSIAAGQRINIKQVNANGASSASATGIWLCLAPTSGQSRMIGAIVDNFSNSKDQVSWGMLFARWCGVAITDAQTRMPFPRATGTISNGYAFSSAAGTGTGKTKVEFVKNGTPGNPSLDIPTATVGAIALTGNVAVVREDLVNLKLTVTGGNPDVGPTIRTVSAQIDA